MALAIIVMPRLTKYLIVYISTESFGCECIKILDLARSKCNKRVSVICFGLNRKAQAAMLGVTVTESVSLFRWNLSNFESVYQ